MMTVESDIAGQIARKGLRIIGKLLDELDAKPADKRGERHVRDVVECVQAAVKVQAEEREQIAFERDQLTGDLRELLKAYLAQLPPAEVGLLVAESQQARPKQEAQPHA